MAALLTSCARQKITFEEYLPALLGRTLGTYDPVNGYVASTDPSPSVEFITVGHRLYHTMATAETRFFDPYATHPKYLGLSVRLSVAVGIGCPHCPE